jgi:hypothetical protein
MSFDQRIHARCAAHARALEQLATASIEIDGVAAKFDLLREHLRRLYSCHPAAFSSSLIELIKGCTAAGAKTFQLNNCISTDDKSFVVGHFYLAKAGIFQEVAVDPYPKIAPDVYPKCKTPYFKKWMWEEHLRLIQETYEKQKKVDEFAKSYVPPTIFAADEIDQIKFQYDTDIREAHRLFVENLGIPYSGTSISSRTRRITHCYSCKNHLDNAIDTECNTCHWIVCGCGACGCGYSDAAQPSFHRTCAKSSTVR